MSNDKEKKLYITALLISLPPAFSTKDPTFSSCTGSHKLHFWPWGNVFIRIKEYHYPYKLDTNTSADKLKTADALQ